MSIDSPVSLLVDTNGVKLPVQHEVSIPANTPAILVAGRDELDIARHILVDGYSAQVVSGFGPQGALPISGTVVGSVVSGSITGTVTCTQGLAGSISNAWSVKEDFQNGEIRPTQTGANNVLTFTFSAPVQEVWIESSGTGLVSRADPFGGTPSATDGIPCYDEVPRKIRVITSTVQVYGPTGAEIMVWGLRR